MIFSDVAVTRLVQLPIPVASEMRYFHIHCVPSAILRVPRISSFAVGPVVPIPTFHPDWNMREEKSQFHPVPNRGIYHSEPFMTQEAATVDADATHHAPIPLASETSTSHDPAPVRSRICQDISRAVVGFVLPRPIRQAVS